MAYKCNTDGSSQSNKCLNSKVFCVGNSQGDLVFASANKIDFCSTLETEIKGCKGGLLCCLQHNWLPLIMETDSLIIKKILYGTWDIFFWIISVEVGEIRATMVNKNMTVQHKHREANFLN